MSAADQVNQLLADCGAILSRSKNHEVWLLPNGKKFTRGLTPSDERADANSLSDLKRALGITKTVATVGERRPKVVKKSVERPVKYDKAVNGSLAEQLKEAGISDEAIRDRMSALESRIANLEQLGRIERETYRRLEKDIYERFRTLETHVAKCWACRIGQWWQRVRRDSE